MQLRRHGPAFVLSFALAWAPLRADASPFSIRTLREPASGEAGQEDPRVSKAKAEYERGSAAYAMGNYAEAVAFFERSYELSHQSALLFNLGQSYLKWYDISSDLQHLRKAKKLFENYRLFLEGSDPVDPESIETTDGLSWPLILKGNMDWLLRLVIHQSVG